MNAARNTIINSLEDESSEEDYYDNDLADVDDSGSEYADADESSVSHMSHGADNIKSPPPKKHHNMVENTSSDMDSELTSLYSESENDSHENLGLNIENTNFLGK